MSDPLDYVIDFICYNDDKHYPFVHTIDSTTLQKVYELFNKHVQFVPTSSTEHYYYGIYEEKKQNYKQMKVHHKTSTEPQSTWMLAKYYHIIKGNIEKAKLYYVITLQSLYNDHDFLEVLGKLSSDDFGYLDDHLKELRELIYEEAETGNQYARYLHSYSQLKISECNFDKIHEYLTTIQKNDIKEVSYLRALFYSCEGDQDISFITNSYYNVDLADKYYIESISDDLSIPDIFYGGKLNMRNEHIHFLSYSGQHLKVLQVFDKYYDIASIRDEMLMRNILYAIEMICKVRCNIDENKIKIIDSNSMKTLETNDKIFDLIKKILLAVDINKREMSIGMVLLKESLSIPGPNIVLEIVI